MKLFDANQTPDEVMEAIREARPESWKVVDSTDLSLAV